MALRGDERARVFAAILLLTTFVTGVLAGVGLDRWALRRDFGDGDRPRVTRADRQRPGNSWRRGAGAEWIIRELELDAEQRVVVDSLLERQRRRGREIQLAVRPRLDSLTEQTHRELISILTPEQRRRWDELHEERSRRRDRPGRRGR